MMNKLFFPLTALAAAVSTSGYAGVMGDAQTHFTHASGWVLGGDVGYGYLSTDERDLFPLTFNSGESQTASHQIGSLIGGGYVGYTLPTAQKFLTGLEIGYKYLGKSTYDINRITVVPFSNQVSDTNSNYKIQQQAVDLLLTGRYFVWDRLSFVGKIGGAFVNSKTAQLTTTTVTNNPSANINFYSEPVIWRLRPEVGVGASYSFNEHWDLNLMFAHIHGVDTNVGFRFLAPGDVTPASYEYNGLTAGISWTL